MEIDSTKDTTCSSPTIKTMLKVFNDEIAALEHIRDELAYSNDMASEFEKAVDIIFACKGKVILTGIGKSGLIAKKIAATLSSTGTKAIFIHPVEGMHGDFGIVERGCDCLITISKSGTSDELLSLLPFFANFNIPVISITANKQSELAKNSQVVLHMPIEREACPLNLAPTTSTTASLVIGDAIAIALMTKNKLKKETFALYHPSGRLGKSLLFRVKDIMWSGNANPTVSIDDDMKHVIYIITSKRLGAVSVLDEHNKFTGLITDYDIRTHLNKDINRDIFDKKAKHIMNANPTFVYENMMAVDVITIMEDRKRPFNVLPVVDDDNNCVGMIRLHDLVKVGL